MHMQPYVHDSSWVTCNIKLRLSILGDLIWGYTHYIPSIWGISLYWHTTGSLPTHQAQEVKLGK
jgi:hypothetical protein